MSFSKNLLFWYGSHSRILPWRNISDPYLTWISEIMLQQTQVNTVIPYFTKWKKQYPSVGAVAGASLDSLLKSWESLGYYSRCRNIHRAAVEICNRHGGLIPDTYSDLRALPGIGDYTASAILSIGFKKKYPAIDGNVTRVMSRIMNLAESDSKNRNQVIRNEMSRLMPDDAPGDFNQALMDLGSMVCIPEKPECNACPVIRHCAASRAGKQNEIMAKKKRNEIPHYNIAAGMIWNGDTFYIQKRPFSGHLGGLWEFPGGKIQPDEDKIAALIREIREECGFNVNVIDETGTVNHTYSHFRITLTLFHCELLPSGGVIMDSDKNSKWIGLDEIDSHAFPKANHKLFEIILKQ